MRRIGTPSPHGRGLKTIVVDGPLPWGEGGESSEPGEGFFPWSLATSELGLNNLHLAVLHQRFESLGIRVAAHDRGVMHGDSDFWLDRLGRFHGFLGRHHIGAGDWEKCNITLNGFHLRYE